jgi:hypothetical protein
MAQGISNFIVPPRTRSMKTYDSFQDVSSKTSAEAASDASIA